MMYINCFDINNKRILLRVFIGAVQPNSRFFCTVWLLLYGLRFSTRMNLNQAVVAASLRLIDGKRTRQSSIANATVKGLSTDLFIVEDERGNGSLIPFFFIRVRNIKYSPKPFQIRFTGMPLPSSLPSPRPPQPFIFQQNFILTFIPRYLDRNACVESYFLWAVNLKPRCYTSSKRTTQKWYPSLISIVWPLQEMVSENSCWNARTVLVL